MSKHQSMSDCAPNIDFNASVIDDWTRQTRADREARQKNDPKWVSAMKRVRRTHVCHHCRKYPGDQEYIFGMWDEGVYYCFDHIP